MAFEFPVGLEIQVGDKFSIIICVLVSLKENLAEIFNSGEINNNYYYYRLAHHQSIKGILRIVS